MTSFYDQDDARDRVQTAIQPGPLPRRPLFAGGPDAEAGTGIFAPDPGRFGPDRRSSARRQADRSIIADQAETIRLLEARLAMTQAKADQRDEAVRLLRACLNGWDFDSEDEWVGAVRAFLAGLEG